MRRTTFDALLTVAGAGLAIILLVAGALLTWGYTFTNSQVHNQLAAQKIYFPAKGSEALASPQIGPYLNQYAGQQLVNGAQAEAYANHFIAVHLQTIAGGKTYSQLSSQALAQPNNTKLAAQVNTVFRGTALRGMLLDAYAFWKIGQIAGIAAIVSFAGAALMLILSILGLVHLRRTSPQAEVLPGLATHVKAAAA
jgi:hypothetical protein